MENWKRVVLGVVLSFMAFFTCIGYAALEDTLTITGTVNASMPEGIFITNIEHVSGTDLGASIVYPTNMQAALTGASGATAVYKITVYNNTDETYIYTGTKVGDAYEDVPVTITASADEANESQIPLNPGSGYASGTPVEPGGTFTFYTTYTLTGMADGDAILVNYNFEPVIYKIEYINNSVVLDTRYVYDNTVAVSTENTYAAGLAEADMNDDSDQQFIVSHWINAGTTRVDIIDAENTEDVVLYPAFGGVYTAIFVDQAGTILDWCTFTQDDQSEFADTRSNAEEALKASLPSDLALDYWEIRVTNDDGETTNRYTLTDDFDFSQLTSNVTIYPIYTYDGDVKLIPVDDDGDGDTDYYQVGNYSNPDGQALVVIPGVVNGVPVTEINANAFSSYDGVHSVEIPSTVTTVGNNILAEAWGWGNNGETVTIYYAGSRADWEAKEQSFDANWDSGLGGDSRIFFLNGTDKVDLTQGYLQANVTGSGSSKSLTWTANETVTDDIVTEYTGYCDCELATTGDTAHTYVDADGNVMGRNAEGTPVNSEGTVIEYKREYFWESYMLTTDFSDTYYRFRPDIYYWTDTLPTILENLPDETETNEIELIWDGMDMTNMVWYPVDEQKPVPGDSYEIAFEPAEGYVMAETVTVIIDDAEYVVQTNGYVPEGEVIPAYDPARNVLTIPAQLLTAETKTVAVVACAVLAEPAEETEPMEETTEATDPTEESTEATDPTEESTEATDPTEESTEATDPTEESTEATDPTEESTAATDPIEESTEATDPTEESTEITDPTEESTESSTPATEEPAAETTVPTPAE